MRGGHAPEQAIQRDPERAVSAAGPESGRFGSAGFLATSRSVSGNRASGVGRPRGGRGGFGDHGGGGARPLAVNLSGRDWQPRSCRMSDQPAAPSGEVPEFHDPHKSRLVPQLLMMFRAFIGSPVRNTLFMLGGLLVAVIGLTAYGQIRLNSWN